LEPCYRWILTDRHQRQTDIGEEAGVSHHFDLAGEIGLEGKVYHEGVEHSVHWRISVRSLLHWWTPHEREFEIPIPCEVEFSVIPFEPLPDSLEFMWFIDGVDEEIYDLGLYHTFRDTGIHTVTAIAYDGAEVDTVVWTIRVFDPNAVHDDRASLLPSEVNLYPAAPNPFNSTTRVRYFLPIAGEVRLSMYDSAGRLVQTLADGWQSAGERSSILHGGEMAAGVYLLRLEVGSAVKTGKVVLLK